MVSVKEKFCIMSLVSQFPLQEVYSSGRGLPSFCIVYKTKKEVRKLKKERVNKR